MRPNILDPDILTKIQAVEGEKYGQDDPDLAPLDALSPIRRSARAAYLEWVAGHVQRADGGPGLTPNTSTGIVIYGTGGWNRYYVRGSGEVHFSVHHSTEKNRQKAAAQGFPLFG